MATIFRYPSKRLDDHTDYVKITCYEYVPPGVGELSSGNFNIPTSDTNYEYRTIGNREVRGYVLLPIPQKLPLNSQSVSWTEGNINGLSATALGSITEVLNDKSLVDALPKGIMGFINKATNAIQTGKGQATVQQFAASEALKQLTGQDLFGEVLRRQGGVVFNENIELLFGGVNLRGPFDLTFDLAPRGVDEKIKIKDMIFFLKQEMSAKKGSRDGGAGGLFLSAPSVFKVEYMSGNKEHPFLNRYKICALQNLSLDFTGSNTYSTYSDGTPVHMILNLQFQELTPIYSEDYNRVQNPEANLGVAY
jgi:hypothetical protein